MSEDAIDIYLFKEELRDRIDSFIDHWIDSADDTPDMYDEETDFYSWMKKFEDWQRDNC